MVLWASLRCGEADDGSDSDLPFAPKPRLASPLSPLLLLPLLPLLLLSGTMRCSQASWSACLSSSASMRAIAERRPSMLNRWLPGCLDAT